MIHHGRIAVRRKRGYFIDRDAPIYTPGNRPVYFGHAGKPIPELL